MINYFNDRRYLNKEYKKKTNTSNQQKSAKIKTTMKANWDSSVQHHLDMLQSITKNTVETKSLKLLSLETMNTQNAKLKWIHVYLYRYMWLIQDGYTQKGAGIHSDLFSFYKLFE